MKKKHFIVFAIGTIAILCIVAFLRLSIKLHIQDDNKQMSEEQLFVYVNSDTLITYLTEYREIRKYPSLVIKKKSNSIVISHNKNSNILLNRRDNYMTLERRQFENIIDEKDGITFITLELSKKDKVQYAKCPTPIIVDILRLRENRQKKHE